MSQEVKRIEDYNLLDFMLSVEKAIKEGWSLSTDNDKYPQNFGGWYSAGVVKDVIPVGTVEIKPVEETPEDKPTRGRKVKG